MGIAIVLAIGFYIPSFAATGWVKEGDKWYYYDSNQNPITNKWKIGEDGVSYYFGEDGAMLIDTWIDGSNDIKYYVNNSGGRVVNGWKLLYEDGDAIEENWFYFDENGKMVKSKKTIDGLIYYFDRNGRMLTGWIAVSGNYASQLEEKIAANDIYYCDRNGQRVIGWADLYAPEDTDGENGRNRYFFKSNGKIRKEIKAVINNESYIFDTEGKMLSGWVYLESTGYIGIDEVTYDSSVHTDVSKYLFCGEKGDGAVKELNWIHYVAPGYDNDDDDQEKNWYFAGRGGELYYAGVNLFETSLVQKVRKEDIGTYRLAGDIHTVILKKIDINFYVFDEFGRRVTGLIKSFESNSPVMPEGYYYLEETNGIMKKGMVNLTGAYDLSYEYYFSENLREGHVTYQGVTGTRGGKLYNEGLLVTAQEGIVFQVVKINVFSWGTGEMVPNLYIIDEAGNVMTEINTIYTADSGSEFKNMEEDTINGGFVIQKLNWDGTWVLVTASDIWDYY